MRFTESHEWIQVDGHQATIGITDYAQQELGEIVYVELPKVGEKVKAGQEICVLESTKAASDVYAPLSGKVLAVNDHVKENPATINQSAEKSGWLFKLEISHPKELDHLLSLERYRALTSK